jgi:tetratricopeptide (TPR) repeat protein
MSRQLTGKAVLAAALVVGSATVAAAQPRMNRGPNPDAPQLMVSACRIPDKVTATLCADKIRSQIEGDVSFRSLLVRTKADVEGTLQASGYDPGVALAPGDAIALAKQIRADLYIDADVDKTSGGFKVDGAIVLARDANMRQPIGPFEHAKIETIAQQVSKAFQDVFNRTFEKSKDCFTKERERRYDEALRDAADALKDYPNSTWARYCKLAIYKSQKKGNPEMIELLSEIVKLDPGSKSALQDLVLLYDATGEKEKKIALLEQLRQADPSNAKLTADIINELAAMGQFEKAEPLAREAVAANPGDLNLIRPYWLILMNKRAYKEAIEMGKKMATMDTASADTSYFGRMIAAANADSNFAEAADLSDKAAIKFPNVAEYHLFAVALYRKAGNIPKSVAAAKRALKINPKFQNMRASIASAYIGENTFAGVDSAIAIVKDMVANGEDKEQIAGVAVGAGNAFRTLATPDSVKAHGGDDAAVRTATMRAFEVTAWADTLAKGSALAGTATFVNGVAALSVGQIYLTDAGEVSKKLQEDFKAAAGNAAKQKQIIDEANPRACAAATKAGDYFGIARAGVLAGGRSSPQAAQQTMSALIQMDGYVDSYKKSFCKP